MSDKTYVASVLTPYYMSNHREVEERYLKERTFLEAVKELENDKEYIIKITSATADRPDLDAIETRVKVHIREEDGGTKKAEFEKLLFS